MKILIFNWRDIKNPLVGGAEVLTHENAKRWVRAGHEITLFTSAFPHCLKKETIDGVNIVRSGNKYTVYWQAFRHYKKCFQGKFDLVIDEINTVPFFTPFYVREKIIVSIHQLCRKIWFYESPLFLAIIGYLLEPLYLRIYKKTQVITISQSTRKDLVHFGFQEKRIHIVPVGLGFSPLSQVPEKSSLPTVAYVGRLKKSKRIHHIIRAFGRIKDKMPGARLWLVGEGDKAYQNKLQRLVKKLNLQDVRFFGYKMHREKLRLLRSAWILVMTSVKEGWGLAITEAHAMGVPTVVYNVSGLKDSTIDNRTGLICSQNKPVSLAENVLRLLNDKALHKRLSENALKHSRDFNWDRSAQEGLSILKRIAKQRVTKTPLVSIVIPTKSNNKNLQECLNHCQRLDYPDYEIIVLPDKAEKLSYSQVKVIPTGAIGPSEKRDIGIKYARGEILAFLDDDAFPTKDWLKNALPFLDDDNVAAIGGPGITPHNDGLRKQASGLVYSSLLATGSISYRYIPKREREVDDFPTCNLLIRKSIMDSLGGFGVKFWPGEDTKLCLHIVRDLGKKIIYAPKVLIYHHRRPLFIPHLKQIRGYALHRGYFAKRFPHTSRRFSYFIPSLFVLGLFFGWSLGFIHPFFFKTYLGVILVYLVCILFTGLKHRNPKLAFLVSSGILATNFSYGIFFLRGLFSRRLKEE